MLEIIISGAECATMTRMNKVESSTIAAGKTLPMTSTWPGRRPSNLIDCLQSSLLFVGIEILLGLIKTNSGWSALKLTVSCVVMVPLKLKKLKHRIEFV